MQRSVHFFVIIVLLFIIVALDKNMWLACLNLFLCVCTLGLYYYRLISLFIVAGRKEELPALFLFLVPIVVISLHLVHTPNLCKPPNCFYTNMYTYVLCIDHQIYWFVPLYIYTHLITHFFKNLQKPQHNPTYIYICV